MRFLSLFSGIEAASCAWLPLNWTCVGVAENEPFPSAVLHHHYPDVPNLGDVTKIQQQDIQALGKIDLVVGGFPCQDVSVAGKRKGLKNADGTSTRSGLFFDAMRIIEWAQPRWTLVENVPGLFSSNGGCDFAAVVGELAGVRLDVPREGWGTAGFALGGKGLVEWRVLDAQFFGLAQRRNRVFIIRDSGDWSSRLPILLERESLRWNPPSRRETREGTAERVAPSIGASGRGTARAGESRGQDCAIPIQELGKRQSGGPNEGVGHGAAGDPMFTLQSGAVHGVCVASVSAVRRLTPTECERLQGFPDGYTAIPWRGKPAEQCPDGPRYRALGNCMAVPVMRWIGEQIALIEKIA